VSFRPAEAVEERDDLFASARDRSLDEGAEAAVRAAMEGGDAEAGSVLAGVVPAGQELTPGAEQRQDLRLRAAAVVGGEYGLREAVPGHGHLVHITSARRLLHSGCKSGTRVVRPLQDAPAPVAGPSRSPQRSLGENPICQVAATTTEAVTCPLQPVSTRECLPPVLQDGC
jgi:hypothetical protein